MCSILLCNIADILQQKMYGIEQTYFIYSNLSDYILLHLQNLILDVYQLELMTESDVIRLDLCHTWDI